MFFVILCGHILQGCICYGVFGSLLSYLIGGSVAQSY